MLLKHANKTIQLLKGKGVSFDPGLSHDEVDKIQQRFGLIFPPDLLLFLQTALPVSEGFVHWRYGLNSVRGKESIDQRLNWPLEGMLFDIQNNAFWLEAWGDRPAEFAQQKEIAVEVFAQQPQLIPIYSHRYISSEPTAIGNPVFSVYQMDIIHYGADLMDYFAREFLLELPLSYQIQAEPKRIRFWSDMIDLNNLGFE